MNRIEKQAEFYRGYLADDRSLAAVAAVLVTGIAVWLLIYLVSLIGPAPGRGAFPSASGAGDPSGPAAELTQRAR
ncbi:hypothetical protein DFR50_10361 [Roseiarcus fermentans]|uniref:Uncharacterized protein n=1 Tax=Roseiarcus fermentans TaxID=1473586 RepID=A0A366FSQ5_9HYPH|nr:hypothetical protein [Roseiarcus fermentans]RBP17176.1 hypothetical protein DFR50_10361 [Roseiarcus fermentans]